MCVSLGRFVSPSRTISRLKLDRVDSILFHPQIVWNMSEIIWTGWKTQYRRSTKFPKNSHLNSLSGGYSCLNFVHSICMNPQSIVLQYLAELSPVILSMNSFLVLRKKLKFESLFVATTCSPGIMLQTDLILLSALKPCSDMIWWLTLYDIFWRVNQKLRIEVWTERINWVLDSVVCFSVPFSERCCNSGGVSVVIIGLPIPEQIQNEAFSDEWIRFSVRSGLTIESRWQKV
jgi:hypothetical protein